MNIDLAPRRAPLPLTLILVVLASLAGAGPPVASEDVFDQQHHAEDDAGVESRP